MDNLEAYKKYFILIDERTPFLLFKAYVLQLIELAENQQDEIKKLESKGVDK